MAFLSPWETKVNIYSLFNKGITCHTFSALILFKPNAILCYFRIWPLWMHFQPWDGNETLIVIPTTIAVLLYGQWMPTSEHYWSSRVSPRPLNLLLKKTFSSKNQMTWVFTIPQMFEIWLGANKVTLVTCEPEKCQSYELAFSRISWLLIVLNLKFFVVSGQSPRSRSGCCRWGKHFRNAGHVVDRPCSGSLYVETRCPS